jgi:NADPH:quinone reductase-like Zn-dependent oxidoreductase
MCKYLAQYRNSLVAAEFSHKQAESEGCAVKHTAAAAAALLVCVLHTPTLQLVELMKAGKLKVTIDQVLPLADAAKAHEVSEAGHVRGKLVLQVAKE